MSNAFFWIVFGCFSIATLSLAIYGLHLYALLLLFKRRERGKRSLQQEIIGDYQRSVPPDHWPTVTSQIPIYNEVDVSKRVMQAVAAMDYPKDKHQIQVLDDSTDETCELIDHTANALIKQGYNVQVVRRDDRTDFKAGALSLGLESATGKHIAVFDADFVPPVEFLQRAIPLLEADERMACIQGRWDHLNRHESWLTEAQALGIDGHFAVEQGARAWNGLMMNFNGTAGVWRKEAILDPDVGGWCGDTLTEDLDLSYRAQLAGWRIDYCLDMPCPAELPGTIDALKSQQRRWATGSIQVARKLLPRIWRSQRSLGEKIEATLHLTHYSVAVWMLLLALVARPMLLVVSDGRIFSSDWFWLAWVVVIISALAPSFTYAYARYSLGGRWSGLKVIPSMFVLGCGLCVNNSLAVIRGFRLRGGEFVRTPKSGSAGEHAKKSSYRVANSHMWLVELALAIYSLLSFIKYYNGDRRTFSLFLLMYAAGFAVVGWTSRPRRAHAATPSLPDHPPIGATVAAVPEPARSYANRNA